MRLRVLGSAAGGGFPQWNCGCPRCAGVRTGTLRAKPRTQESVAVSADGERWILLNASPEIRAQIESFPGLHPKSARHSPIAGIVLTNGDLDHCLGLLSLRESHPLTVFATRAVEEGFRQGNALYRTLERFEGQVRWQRIRLDEPFELSPGLSAEAWAVPGKLPIHLAASRSASADDNIGLRIGGALTYLPAVGALGDRELAAVRDSKCAFFDGTFFTADELQRIDPKAPRAEAMAHVPIEQSLPRLPAGPNRFYIHVNNTNPILDETSRERARVREAGWDVAWDDQELSL